MLVSIVRATFGFFTSAFILGAVNGVPKTREGTVDAPLARSPINRKKIAIVEARDFDRRGKRAVTHWRRLNVLDGAALVECRLETGRTHQVRVHMASIGHPLLGDPVYGRSGKLLKELGFHRQALHAAQLGFTHPVTKNRLSFVSPMPPGGGWLLILKVTVCPALGVKSVQTTLLSPLGLNTE